jgi:hypothetical protein
MIPLELSEIGDWPTGDMFRAVSVLERIRLPFGWEVYPTWSPESSTLFIQIGDSHGVDNVTGAPMAWRGRRWVIERTMDAGEIARTVLMATLAAAEHEIREQVLVGGKAVFDPHFRVQL